MARFELSKELIGMFSEMLREMDRNTIRYMVDDMNQKIENGKVELAGLKDVALCRLDCPESRLIVWSHYIRATRNVYHSVWSSFGIHFFINTCQLSFRF